MNERLAAEVRRDPQGFVIEFRVSAELIDEYLEWQGPVFFRFEQDEYGRWDLIMKKADA